MADNFVITIGRQFGSGGRDIGRMVAERLGIKCYDKEIIELAAQENNISQDILEKHDEKPMSGFLSGMVSDIFSSGYSKSRFVDVSLEQQVFLAQFDTIKNLAEKESCVIVGRCGNYALQEHKNVLNVFVYADMDFRVNQVLNVYKIEGVKKPAEFIMKMDKKRASYYNYYTNEEWGNAASYDLCLNSSKFGVEGCVDIILDVAKRMQEK